MRKPCTGLDLLVHGHVQGMDRFRPSADVLIARVVVCEIGEFYRDIMRKIRETTVEVPEHFPLLHAPPEHVACCLQMAQIGLQRGQEGFERGVLLKAEQPMQGRFSRCCHGRLLKRMRIEGRLPATVVSQVQVPERGPPRQRLPPSPDLHEPIGLFRVLHSGQQLLCLTMNTIHELLIGIDNPVTLQDGFSQPAQDTSFDGAKPQSVDQQSRGLPDDFVLEDEMVWLEGMVSKVRFQLEERMEPFAVAGKDGRAVAEYGEGGFFPCLVVMACVSCDDTR